MSGSLAPLRTARRGLVRRLLDGDGRAWSEFASPLFWARLRVIGLAACSPMVVAGGVAALNDGGAMLQSHAPLPAPDTPVRAVVASPWMSTTMVAATTKSTTSTTTSTTTVTAGATEDKLRDFETLSSALARHGISTDDVSAAARALRGVLPAGAVRPGLAFVVHREGSSLRKLVLQTATDDGAPRLVTLSRALTLLQGSSTTPATPATLASASTTPTSPAPATTHGPTAAAAHPVSPPFDVAVTDVPVDVVVEGLAGNVDTTLADGIQDAGGDAALVDRFVDVFAGEVDFYRSTRAGDEFRLLIEKRYVGSGAERRFVGYGRVVAAEYVGAGRVHRGFAYTSADGQVTGVFDELGSSRRRELHTTPLDLASVTSTHGERFDQGGTHATTGGVDYGAPLGTPVWSTGDGVVIDARFGKTEGNIVVVRHSGRLTTTYQHLARLADGIKPGARVTQKQTLGFVGSTGASTGPHLHYGVHRGDVIVDDIAATTHAAPAVPDAYRASFDAFVAPLIAQLRALARA